MQRVDELIRRRGGGAVGNVDGNDRSKTSRAIIGAVGAGAVVEGVREEDVALAIEVIEVTRIGERVTDEGRLVVIKVTRVVPEHGAHDVERREMNRFVGLLAVGLHVAQHRVTDARSIEDRRARIHGGTGRGGVLQLPVAVRQLDALGLNFARRVRDVDGRRARPDVLTDGDHAVRVSRIGIETPAESGGDRTDGVEAAFGLAPVECILFRVEITAAFEQLNLGRNERRGAERAGDLAADDPRGNGDEGARLAVGAAGAGDPAVAVDRAGLVELPLRIGREQIVHVIDLLGAVQERAREVPAALFAAPTVWRKLLMPCATL